MAAKTKCLRNHVNEGAKDFLKFFWFFVINYFKGMQKGKKIKNQQFAVYSFGACDRILLLLANIPISLQKWTNTGFCWSVFIHIISLGVLDKMLTKAESLQCNSPMYNATFSLHPSVSSVTAEGQSRYGFTWHIIWYNCTASAKGISHSCLKQKK